METGNCIDTLGRFNEERAGCYSCYRLGGRQAFVYTKRNQIMSSSQQCLTADITAQVVQLATCEKHSRQEWIFIREVLVFMKANLLLV